MSIAFFLSGNAVIGSNILVAFGTLVLAFMAWKTLKRDTEPNLRAIFTTKVQKKPELLEIAVVNAGKIPVIIHFINIFGISTGENLEAKRTGPFTTEDENQISYKITRGLPDVLSPGQKRYAKLVCLKDDVFRKEKGYKLEVKYSARAKEDKKIACDVWTLESKQKKS